MAGEVSPATSAWISTGSTCRRSSPSTSGRPRRTSTASSTRRRRERDPLLRRGGRALRQAIRGPRRARPLREHRGRLPAPADGVVRRRVILATNSARTSTRRSCAASLRDRLPLSRSPRTGSGSGTGSSLTLPRSHEDIDVALPRRAVQALGGSIRNVSLAAAFLAAEDGGSISMRHLDPGSGARVRQARAAHARVRLRPLSRADPTSERRGFRPLEPVAYDPKGQTPLPFQLPARAGPGGDRAAVTGDLSVMAVASSVPLNTMLADLDEILRCAAQARARAARVRRRRDRLRGAHEGMGGGALVADGQRLPLRPARGDRPAGQRVAGAARQRPGLHRAARRCESTPPTPSPRGRARSRTSTACSHRCSPSSTRTRSCPDDILAGTPRERQPAVPARHEGRAGPRRGQGRLLDVDRRPVQGVDRLHRVTSPPIRARRIERGPEVRTQTVQVRDPAASAATIEEFHRIGGVVRDADGEPVGERLGGAPDRRRLDRESDADGRFRFARLQPGSYSASPAPPTAPRRRATLEVPGQGVELRSAEGQVDRAEARRARLGQRRLPQWLPTGSLEPRGAEDGGLMVCPSRRGRRVCCSETWSR